MCIECSGTHRSLGVHLSFVRSINMDSWSEKQLNCMRVGGNESMTQFLKQQGFPGDLSIEDKYAAPAMELYRKHIAERAEGRQPAPIPRVGFSKAPEAPKKPIALDNSHLRASSGGSGGGGSSVGDFGGSGPRKYVLHCQ